MRTETDQLSFDGRRIEYRVVQPTAANGVDLVMLHEGLGSVSMWQKFPEQLARETGCRVLVYSRHGYGRSSPLDEPRRTDYMHEEARIWLPAILERFAVRRPVLFGHSDGASIALIYAASAGDAIAGVIAIAPHIKVEDVTVRSIDAARSAYLETDLRTRLSRHHDDVDSAFWGWNRIWLDPLFRDWNIEALLPSISCPLLVIQGQEDEYGTMEQITGIARAAPDAKLLALPNCRHSPHRDQPQAVLAATRKFLADIAAGTATAGGHANQRRAAPHDVAYLHRLGDKIRDARAQRGMTRNALAADSGVSLRFLAQLEGGQGNPSILVLRKIASALGFPPGDLLSDEPPPTIERLLLMQSLKRLSDDDIAEARRLLAQQLAIDAVSDIKKPYVALIGLRGAGKTTLGRRLAAHRGIPFFELDREVEREYGATIGEILQLHGQPGYRRFEREILQAVLSKNPAAIIETGGGLAADPETLPLLLASTLAVWVRASPEEHMQRVIDQGDLRPMARSREAMRELKDILKAREPFYRQAPLHLTTSGRTAGQSFRDLLELLEPGQRD